MAIKYFNPPPPAHGLSAKGRTPRPGDKKLKYMEKLSIGVAGSCAIGFYTKRVFVVKCKQKKNTGFKCSIKQGNPNQDILDSGVYVY